MNTSRKLIDWEYLREMVADDDWIVYNLCKSFQDQAPTSLKAIRDAMAQANPHQLEQAAHHFKGSIALFGARDAIASLQHLEDAGRSSNLSELENSWKTLEESVESMLTEIRDIQRNRVASA